ncbi:MAG TPA: hypothetical protein VF627_08990 [Abditibacterium sp.]
MKTFPIWWLALGFPLYFAALWIGITGLLSRLAWSALATVFTAPHHPTGQKFGLVSASIGGVNYNNCLTAIVASEGLWLQPWRLFRLFHPPLLIPWNAFSPFETTQILWAKRSVATVQIPNGRRIKMALMPASLVEAMRRQIEKTV